MTDEMERRFAMLLERIDGLEDGRFDEPAPDPRARSLDTVTLPRMTEKAAASLAREVAGAVSVSEVVPPSRIVGAHAMLKHLGLIREKSPAERCAAALGISPDLAERVLAWAVPCAS